MKRIEGIGEVRRGKRRWYKGRGDRSEEKL